MPDTTTLLDAGDSQSLTRAAQLLADGEVVAFPTETVYGLGANGLQAEAVQKIFQAKNRPADNPLILHVHSFEQAIPLWQASSEQIDLARKLAAAFWPGPLSLVLPAAAVVPTAVTAGLGSVAVRAPAGPVAHKLLALCPFPVAAPSANLSGRPSPTCAAHVAATLSGRIAAILDGGLTQVGIESTVLDLCGELPRILRLGDISAASIAEVVGKLDSTGPGCKAPSPGLRHRHYRPAGMELQLLDSNEIAGAWEGSAAILCRQSTAVRLGERTAPLVILPDRARAYGAGLYAALYDMEASDATLLLIEKVPNTPDWLAINDRLKRAVEG